MMVQGFDDRIKSPGAYDVVSLGAQIGRKMLRKPVWIIGPAPNDLRRARRGGPGIHDIHLRNEVVRATATGLLRLTEMGIDGQLFTGCQDGLTAGTTGPGG